jgi:V/A-type H+-transporting ATPase subunit E
MKESTTNAAGVQQLIDRIRDEGVRAAQAEADRILREARRQAADLMAEAHREADAARTKAQAEIDAHRGAAEDALRLASRDAVLDLKARVRQRFEEFVKRLVVSATRDQELIRSLVLVLAGRAASEFIKDKEIEVRISNALINGGTGPAFPQEGKLAILGLASEMLREGIELVGDDAIAGGARVRLVRDQLEIDLSDRAISRLISQRLLARFQSVMEGME